MWSINVKCVSEAPESYYRVFVDVVDGGVGVVVVVIVVVIVVFVVIFAFFVIGK